MKITFNTDGAVGETTITIDGKELTRVRNATFDVTFPEEDDKYYQGYLSVTWSTEDKKTPEGLSKRTTFQYSPRDSEEVQSISVVSVDKTKFTDEEHSHYMLADIIPARITNDLAAEDNIDKVSLLTGDVISPTDNVKEHCHVATVDICGNGITTFVNGHAHIVDKFKVIESVDHIHTLPFNQS